MNPTPAQILSQSIDHTKWRTPGLGDDAVGGSQHQLGLQPQPDSSTTNQGAADPQLSNPGDRALEESQFTSTMIKQSLADLRHRLQQMKEDKELTGRLL